MQTSKKQKHLFDLVQSNASELHSIHFDIMSAELHRNDLSVMTMLYGGRKNTICIGTVTNMKPKYVI